MSQRAICRNCKKWVSSDSLNGYSCLLLIFNPSTISVISGDFLTRWNAITMGKGRASEGEKWQFWAISLFLIQVFLKEFEVLGLLAQPFNLRRDCIEILLPYGNMFSRFFFVLFCVQNLSGNDCEYHSFYWKDVSVTIVDIFENKQFSLQFFL